MRILGLYAVMSPFDEVGWTIFQPKTPHDVRPAPYGMPSSLLSGRQQTPKTSSRLELA